MRTPANQLTYDVIAQMYKDGAYGFRVNSTGIYDEATKSWRSSNATKGVSDVLCSYRGRMVCVEVKIGSDRQSDDQKAFQSNIEHTESIYFIAKELQQFLADWNKVKKIIDYQCQIILNYKP